MIIWKREVKVLSPRSAEEVRQRLQQTLPRFEVPGTRVVLEQHYYGTCDVSSFSLYGPKTSRSWPTLKVNGIIEASGSGSRILLTVYPFAAVFGAAIISAFAIVIGTVALIQTRSLAWPGVILAGLGGLAVLFYSVGVAITVPNQLALFLAYFRKLVDAHAP